ncbi:MAG TPA: HEAT repeat domain-containing protein [Gammaproteobacteria bacterium]|nr:HEAT repeat domain-containing protein [Gammaproteobacteria bacterium]
MNFITAIQADRLISQIQDQADPSSPAAKKALQKLAKLGVGAIPKILEAFAAADRRQTGEYVEILGSLLSDKTLHLVARGLADQEPRTVAGAAAALAGSRRYNVNRLVDLLAEDEYSKSAIIDVLTAHKDRLNVRQLLAQLYYLQPNEKAAVFKLIDQVATEELVPDLIGRMDGKDPVVKMHLINIVTRFERPEVHRVVQEQLKDSNKLVRMAALSSVTNLKTKVDTELVCSLLIDPDIDVMNKAVDVIVKINDPDTVKYLIPALKAENEFCRRSAVEVLNEIGTTSSVKYLLEAVADEDWWVRARASDALARIGGPRVVDAVLELIKDKDENIRRAAIEILNTCKDKRAVDQLILATQDGDWWVSERAADALGAIGNSKAVPALLKMIARNDRSLPVAIRALGKLGDAQVLATLLPYLQRSEKDVKVAAIEAVADLVKDERQAESVRMHLQQAGASADDTIARAASRALQKLDGRTATSGQFAAATATMNATLMTPAPGPAPSASAPANAGRAAAPRPETPPVSPAATARTLLIEGAEVDAKPTAQTLDISALQPGDIIEGRYKFIQKIGKGAFGTVVLVEDTVVEERLILKFLNPNVASDEEMMKRFVHELRYSRRITHKNVIRIYDFLYISGGYAISMEYFPSHTLGTEIANEKPMNPRKAVGYAIDICVGMQIAHQQNIIHRDLKPANILINDSGLLKIVDFGVAAAAKSGDTQLTKTGYVIGSPKYMAPEQILGKKVDERADIYSLGVILYEMLAGSPPYSRGDHMSVMYQHVQGKAAPLAEANPKVLPELAEIVGRAMAVDKSKRFASMEEFKNALSAVQLKLP